jgi:hypothetical protein
MYVVAPTSRLRRGVRRLALALCALIMGAGFTPALPASTVERPVQPVAAAVAGVDGTTSVARRKAVEVPASMRSERQFPSAGGGAGGSGGSGGSVVTQTPGGLDGVAVGAVAGRAPPSTSV